MVSRCSQDITNQVTRFYDEYYAMVLLSHMVEESGKKNLPVFLFAVTLMKRNGERGKKKK